MIAWNGAGHGVFEDNDFQHSCQRHGVFVEFVVRLILLSPVSAIDMPECNYDMPVCTVLSLQSNMALVAEFCGVKCLERAHGCICDLFGSLLSTCV